MTLQKNSPYTLAIIQARMGSTRLPGKLLLDFHGHTIVEWIYKRVSQANLLDGLIFAIPITIDNDILEDHITAMGGIVYRGSENDLVDRFYQVAHKYKADRIVRVCADNPMICGEVIDHLIEYYDHNQCDYAYNHIPRNNLYPDGLGAEICSIALLDEIKKRAVTAGHKEHLFNYIWDNQSNYNIKTFDPSDHRLIHPELKLDLDTPEDYRYLSKRPYKIGMTAVEIIALSLT
jgi:spore coat polysaccharide biosynthesis protein SpsF